MNFAEIKLNSILQRNLTFDCANGLSVVYEWVSRRDLQDAAVQVQPIV